MISLSPVPATAALLGGLLLGSFLNVCIARLPRHESILWPGSHCPRCAAPVRPWDNIPLLSFLVLGGRCRSCRQPIALRYPLVEAALPLLFVLTALHFSGVRTIVEAATLCFLLLGLAAMDVETLRLPDTFTLPGIALGLLQASLPGGGLVAATPIRLPFAAPHLLPGISSLAGAAGAAALLLLIRSFYRQVRGREGMGLGDVKLIALLGAWLGVGGVLLTLALGVVLGAAAGLGMVAAGHRAQRLPFGAFLCAAGLVSLFLREPIFAWYFSFWR